MPGFLRSELPLRATVRHHWLVILRLPGRNWLIAWAVLLVGAVVWPNPLAWAIALFLVGILWLRWREWKAELIMLTGKRIVRTQGIPETTEVEAWMRLDRVSGMRIVQTVPGKVFRYWRIVLEAPGSHPGTHDLKYIAKARPFYATLRSLVLDGPASPDPDDTGEPPGDFVTSPLPPVAPATPPDYLPRDDYEPPVWHRRQR